MSLDLSKLKNARERGGKIIARCPACAALGHDEKGEHLAIMPDGRFGCVVYPGASGKDHRKEIFALAGEPKHGSFHIRVRRPASASLPKVAGKPINLGRLGTLGTGFAKACAIGTSQPQDDREKEECVQALSVAKNTSQASQPVPSQEPSYPACEEPGRLCDVIDPDTAAAFLRRFVGDRLPALSKWFGQVQASLDAVLAGWNYEDSEFACRLEDVDHHAMTLAAVHAGMVLVGSLYAGQDPRTAGETATEAFCKFLRIAPPADTKDIDPETGYPIIDGAICPF
ncbi:hypothetical protein [Haloferula sp. A504]|uniref:hypothetical protein n=1 Tax=Haloferula sp. A504 TaxID=3373601 RepID=UPI0031CBF3A9|nr:hypothetical protein [Verrucomicrobiaceae bacterium E54]